MKVLTFADLHLRYTVPSCIDCTPSEWMEIQRKALNRVIEIAVSETVDSVYVGGDIFHSESSASFECIVLFQEFCRLLANRGIPTFIMAGNHDLPNHSSENIVRSAIGTVFNSKYVNDMSSADSLIKGCNFDKDEYSGHELIFRHVLCIPEDERPGFIECETPRTLLEKYPDARYVFVGDYHRHFCFEEGGRFVINSGCLTRQASDFEDYDPGVYVTEIGKGMPAWHSIGLEYPFVRNRKSRMEIDDSINDFINCIERKQVSLDFISSLKETVNNEDDDVKEKVLSWISEIGQ